MAIYANKRWIIGHNNGAESVMEKFPKKKKCVHLRQALCISNGVYVIS